MESLAGRVGLFFAMKERIILYACPFERAVRYGDFLNYPYSHDAVWEKLQRAKYGVNYDYYPRGRVIYSVAADKYHIYHDRCCEKAARLIGNRYAPKAVEYRLDEHYQCHTCSKTYLS